MKRSTAATPSDAITPLSLGRAPPIRWSSAVVGCRYGGDSISFVLEDDAVRKPLHACLPKNITQMGKPLRIKCDTIKRGLHLFKEAFRSGCASRKVPVEGGVEVRPCASEKLNFRYHSPRLLCGALPSLTKASPRTTSQGMVVAVPAESSADRRRISAIHSPDSGGSASSGNVSQMASINSSRSATGSCAASASSASMVLILPTLIVFGE